MVRTLEPLEANVKKRLVKAPKVYLRDSGVLHALLEIETRDELLGHPVYGSSWEGMVIENILGTLTDWKPSFYRTAAGAEIDLVLTRGRRRVAVECKASTAPRVNRGLRNALADLDIDEAWIIAPVRESYPLRGGVTVASLASFLQAHQDRDGMEVAGDGL